jgi:RNA polymerase sigma-70 factor (ECF subfamily)
LIPRVEANQVTTFGKSLLYLARVKDFRGPVSIDDKQAFVTAIERQHGRGLRRFLASRLRNAAADLPDLVQEVFMRLLRIREHETIRNPEAYVITIASHVLHQHALAAAEKPEAVDITDALADWESDSDDPLVRAEVRQRIDELERVLAELSPKARTTLMLHRRDGYSLEEIGAQLGISRAMAKKYLAQALAHCRERIRSVE